MVSLIAIHLIFVLSQPTVLDYCSSISILVKCHSMRIAHSPISSQSNASLPKCRSGAQAVDSSRPSASQLLAGFTERSILVVFISVFYRKFFLNNISKMSSCTVPVAPAPPALKDLPKVAGDLKTELEGFSSSKLKNAETQEKIILPSAEDVAQEKTHNALIAGVENFNCSLLKRTDTKEKIVLPNAQDVAAEKTEKALIEGIAKFDQAKLKHTETQEKNPLPDKDVVQQEKTHQNLLSGVEHFDKSTMKHTETSEKVILPNTDVIEQEKTQNNLLSGIENFDSTKLKHAETREKNPLPTKETIEQEKSA